MAREKQVLCGSSEDGLPIFTSYLLLTSCGLGAREQNPRLPSLPFWGSWSANEEGASSPPELPVGIMRQCVPQCRSHCGGPAEALRSQSQPTEEAGKDLSSRRQEGKRAVVCQVAQAVASKLFHSQAGGREMLRAPKSFEQGWCN